MKVKITLASALILASALFLSSCSKDDSPDDSAKVTTDAVISGYVQSIVLPNLKDLNDKATAMNTAVDAFIADKSQDKLTAARQSWLATRVAWEQSEAMLFGPVEDNNFDPRIDSWPVDFNAIQSVWNGSDEFTQDYINGLQDELKGFHPIEFILYGENGDAKPADFTNQREIDYLQAMSLNLKNITDSLYKDWIPSGGNFQNELLTAGSGSQKYTSQQAAMIEIANAMIGIIGEVGDSKLKQPFTAEDPTQAESPFSKNSFTDFKNNITGAQNVYLGHYGSSQGVSLSDFVAQYNKDLDTRIKAKLSAVISNLGGYDVTYGEAISSKRSQVQASIDLATGLEEILSSELIPLIELRAK